MTSPPGGTVTPPEPQEKPELIANGVNYQWLLMCRRGMKKYNISTISSVDLISYTNQILSMGCLSCEILQGKSKISVGNSTILFSVDNIDELVDTHNANLGWHVKEPRRSKSLHQHPTLMRTINQVTARDWTLTTWLQQTTQTDRIQMQITDNLPTQPFHPATTCEHGVIPYGFTNSMMWHLYNDGHMHRCLNREARAPGNAGIHYLNYKEIDNSTIQEIDTDAYYYTIKALDEIAKLHPKGLWVTASMAYKHSEHTLVDLQLGQENKILTNGESYVIQLKVTNGLVLAYCRLAAFNIQTKVPLIMTNGRVNDTWDNALKILLSQADTLKHKFYHLNTWTHQCAGGYGESGHLRGYVDYMAQQCGAAGRYYGVDELVLSRVCNPTDSACVLPFGFSWIEWSWSTELPPISAYYIDCRAGGALVHCGSRPCENLAARSTWAANLLGMNFVIDGDTYSYDGVKTIIDEERRHAISQPLGRVNQQQGTTIDVSLHWHPPDADCGIAVTQMSSPYTRQPHSSETPRIQKVNCMGASVICCVSTEEEENARKNYTVWNHPTNLTIAGAKARGNAVGDLAWEKWLNNVLTELGTSTCKHIVIGANVTRIPRRNQEYKFIDVGNTSPPTVARGHATARIILALKLTMAGYKVSIIGGKDTYNDRAHDELVTNLSLKGHVVFSGLGIVSGTCKLEGDINIVEYEKWSKLAMRYPNHAAMDEMLLIKSLAGVQRTAVIYGTGGAYPLQEGYKADPTIYLWPGGYRETCYRGAETMEDRAKWWANIDTVRERNYIHLVGPNLQDQIQSLHVTPCTTKDISDKLFYDGVMGD
jgi:hypothetical protein